MKLSTTTRRLAVVAICAAASAPTVQASPAGAATPTPVITEVSPTRLSRCGGDKVTITGRRFAPNAAAGIAASETDFSEGRVTSRTSTRITMRTPRRPAVGQAYVYVFQSDGVQSLTDSVVVRLVDRICRASRPTGLRSQTTPEKVQVFWNAPGDDGGQAITGYTIQEKVDGVWRTWIPSWPRTDVNVVPGGGPSRMRIRVAAVGANGLRGAWSDPFSFDIPQP